MNFLQRFEIAKILAKNINYEYTEPHGILKLVGVHKAIEALMELEHSKQPRYTDWYVLLKQDKEGKWEPICCIDEMDERWQEEELPDWEVILPIPNPDDLGEWDGF